MSCSTEARKLIEPLNIAYSEMSKQAMKGISEILVFFQVTRLNEFRKLVETLNIAYYSETLLFF